MHMALATAMAEGFDHYIWLNDDTTLVPDAIMILQAALDTIRARAGDDCIIVGSVRDHGTDEPTYGGVRRPSWWKRSTFVLVRPAAEPVWCETMNGNCVLIPRAVAEKVGNLDSEFAHGLGDYDYGLRARAAGVRVWIAPGYVGYCSRDSRLRAFAPETSLGERLRVMTSRKGLPPRAWARFTRRHCGMFWLIFWAYPYFRTVTDACMSALLGRKKSANA
jgi:GT2 family glycosyltransferase